MLCYARPFQQMTWLDSAASDTILQWESVAFVVLWLLTMLHYRCSQGIYKDDRDRWLGSATASSPHYLMLLPLPVSTQGSIASPSIGASSHNHAPVLTHRWLMGEYHITCRCIALTTAIERLFFYSKTTYHTPSLNTLTNTSKNGCVSDVSTKILTQHNVDETELYRWYLTFLYSDSPWYCVQSLNIHQDQVIIIAVFLILLTVLWINSLCYADMWIDYSGTR